MNNSECSNSLSEVDERVTEELEALAAILMDEIDIIRDESGRPVTVEAVLLPATAADEEQQFVTVTLAVDMPPNYPDASPTIRLRNPRGLSDDLLTKIAAETEAKCEDYIGQPVIYELIELVKEHLTSSNTPSCHCTICLYGFHGEDEFTKTPCFHYFHTHCLACYVRSCQESHRSEREKLPMWQRMQNKDLASETCAVPCPVCREPVDYELERLEQAAPPHEVEAALNFELTDELRSLQRKMASLYVRQQSKGGIIDPEAEESKLLLVTNNVPDSTSSAVPAPTPSSTQQHGYRPQAPGSRSWRTDRDRRVGNGGRAPEVPAPQPTYQSPPTRENGRSGPKAGGSNHRNHHRGGTGRRDRRAHQPPSCESTR